MRWSEMRVISGQMGFFFTSLFTLTPLLSPLLVGPAFMSEARCGDPLNFTADAICSYSLAPTDTGRAGGVAPGTLRTPVGQVPPLKAAPPLHPPDTTLFYPAERLGATHVKPESATRGRQMALFAASPLEAGTCYPPGGIAAQRWALMCVEQFQHTLGLLSITFWLGRGQADAWDRSQKKITPFSHLGPSRLQKSEIPLI